MTRSWGPATMPSSSRSMSQAIRAISSGEAEVEVGVERPQRCQQDGARTAEARLHGHVGRQPERDRPFEGATRAIASRCRSATSGWNDAGA